MKIICVHGFLGSGKTTLIKHIIHLLHGHRIGLCINEFGSVNIDQEEFKGMSIPMTEIHHGSIYFNFRQYYFIYNFKNIFYFVGFFNFAFCLKLILYHCHMLRPSKLNLKP